MREHLVAVLATAVAAAPLTVLLLALAVAVRAVSLRRSRRGAFDCSWRPAPGPVSATEARWRLGVARVGPEVVEWWGLLSLSPRPRSRWRRGLLEVEGRHPAGPGEVPSLHGGVLVVACRHGGEQLELAMSAECYTGFASWLESSPPAGRGGLA